MIAIQWASQYGHTPIVELLLNDSRVKKTVDIESILWNAAAAGYLDIVKVLVKHGVDINKDETNSPLLIASENNHLDIVEYLKKLRRCEWRPGIVYYICVGSEI